MKELKSETITFQVSKKTKELWGKIAEEECRSMSDFIRYAVTVYVTAFETKKMRKEMRKNNC